MASTTSTCRSSSVERVREAGEQGGKGMNALKDIAAILLECTELSPHAVAVQKLTHMPVWDYTSLTNWIYSGCVRRPFTGPL